MAGYTMLNTEDFTKIFADDSSISVPNESEANSYFGYRYTIKKDGNVIILCSPVPVNELETVLEDLKKRFNPKCKREIKYNEPNDHILIGLIGTGTTERHIVTLHIPPEKQGPAQIYDSKYSNIKQFFQVKASLPGRISGILNALNPFAAGTKNLDKFKPPKTLEKGQYNSLGTQSLFDGVSCGYHTATNIKILEEQINVPGYTPSREGLLAESKDPVFETAALLKRQTSLSAFMKNAWQDVFMPGISDKDRATYGFQHYFLGWPKEGSKLVYFATLKFITAPLLNILSLLTEVPLRGTSAFFGYIRDQLIEAAPVNTAAQIARSALLAPVTVLHLGFKYLSYLVRTVTSPIVSYQEAKKQNRALAIASAATSIVLIGGIITALALFATPILLALAPSMSPGAAALIGALATPFIELFGLASLSIPIATAAVLSISTIGAALGILHRIGRNLIYPVSNTAASVPTEQKNKTEGDNDGFDLMDEKTTKIDETKQNKKTGGDNDGFDLMDEKTTKIDETKQNKKTKTLENMKPYTDGHLGIFANNSKSKNNPLDPSSHKDNNVGTSQSPK